MNNNLDHIAFIMDGNNRWSIKNKKNKFFSYEKGAKNLIKLTSFIFNSTNASYVSAFALSTHNLKRSTNIINLIKKILLQFLDEELNQNIINFNIIFKGDISFLNNEIQTKIKLIENKNRVSKKKLFIYINYSGRNEILDIINKIIPLKFKKVNFRDVNSFLTSSTIPDPDILIRTGGYQRISDFFLYQISFTELFFTKKLWPDLTSADLKKIIHKYKLINRKFGI